MYVSEIIMGPPFLLTLSLAGQGGRASLQLGLAFPNRFSQAWNLVRPIKPP
jgi:hypothetical protein